MSPWHKPTNPGLAVAGFGVLLLFLKLVSVPVGIGYFFIFCIIAWPVTLIGGWIGILAFAFTVMYIFDRIEERL